LPYPIVDCIEGLETAIRAIGITIACVALLGLCLMHFAPILVLFIALYGWWVCHRAAEDADVYHPVRGGTKYRFGRSS
jgi:hypothetical protein